MHLYNFRKLRFVARYFSALDCVLSDQALYCSTEFTSGLRLYTEMERSGQKSSSEFKRHFGDEYEELKRTNAKEADRFARLVRRSQTDGTVVINPVPLSVPEWAQEDYLAFWEEVIRTPVKEVHFNDNWEFSDGCTREFVAAVDARVPRFDCHGKKLDDIKAIQAMERAIERFKDLDTTILQENLSRLRSLVVPSHN